MSNHDNNQDVNQDVSDNQDNKIKIVIDGKADDLEDDIKDYMRETERVTPVKIKKYIPTSTSVRSRRSEVSVYNNWKDKNRKTVINWRDDLTQIGFAYDYIISKYRKKEKKYSIWLFIISTIITTISLSQLNNSEDEDKVLSIIYKIVFAILSFIATILSGIQKINNYSKLIEEYRIYVDDLENFVSILSSELILPDNLRKDAIEFILLHRGTFQKFLSNNPDVDDTHYKEGIDMYINYIDNIENRKYNNNKCKLKRDDTIDIDIVELKNH